MDNLRDELFKFSDKVRNIQHYFFHTKQVTVARTVGKLLTRMWWIYHTSSPLMKSWKVYEDFSLDHLLTEYDDEEEISDGEYEDDSEEDLEV